MCCSCSTTVCFPGPVEIILENGKKVTMSELQVGDTVQAGIGKHIFIPKCYLLLLSVKHQTILDIIGYLEYCFLFVIIYSKILLGCLHFMKLVLPSGSVSYSQVTSFMKKQQVITRMYISITTSWNNTLSLSGNHLIYTRKSYMEKFMPMWATSCVSYIYFK